MKCDSLKFSHMFFADDLMVYLEAGVKSITVVQKAL